jgi:glycosyltransferase involved in cell wall biosynthesis
MIVPNPSGTVLIAAAAWHDEHPGGANKLPTDFARFLARRGCHVAYIAGSSQVTGITETQAEGVDIWRYPSPRAASPSLANLRDHWRRARAVAAAVQSRGRVMALLGHSPIQYLAAASVCSAARRCYGVHSPFVEELKESAAGRPTFRQRGAWTVAAMIERKLLALSDVVHYDSAFTRRFMEAKYPNETLNKGIVLPGWVDTARFRPSPESRAARRARLGGPWAADTITFFTLRRLVPRMGLDTLIDAAAALATGDKPFRVIIGGEGPRRDELEAQVAARSLADRVAFVGRLSEETLVDWFSAADCFVLPTRALECFGLIVLESLACGVPVIGVPVGSIPEVLGPALARWIADGNDVASLATRMNQFLTGALSADPAGLRARALEFALESVAARHEDALLGLHVQGAVA